METKLHICSMHNVACGNYIYNALSRESQLPFFLFIIFFCERSRNLIVLNVQQNWAIWQNEKKSN